MEDNQPTNQPVNQPMNQPAYQSANQSPNQIADQPTMPLSNTSNQPSNQSVNQPTNQTPEQPVNPVGNQPTNQIPEQPANPIVNQPVGQSIKRWSDLKDLAVVAIDNGSKIGTLEDFYFDPSANSIRGFRVKTGMFSHRALPATAINAIGTDAVTIDKEDILLHEKDEAEYSTLPLGQSLLNYKVMSESGSFIGNIGNMLLDISTPKTLHIYAFELAGGLRSRISGHYSTFYAQQVVRYGQDVLVIPDAVGTELTR